MKILFISNIFPPHVRGGYELGCLELAEKYQELGHKVLVASSENTAELKNYAEPTHMDVRRIFSPVKYYDHLYDSHFQSNAVYYYDKIMAFAGYIEPNCIALRRLIDLEKPDVIWIFNPLGIGTIGILDTVVSCGIKTIVHLMEHLDGVIEDYSKILNLTGKWRYLKSKVGAVSCSKKISESNKLLGDYSLNRIIYNWVDINKYFINTDFTIRQDSSNSVVNKKDKFKVVYFGQIAEKKGITYLYEAAKYLKKKGQAKKITIELYGKGEPSFVNILKQQILKDGLSEVFVMKGFLTKDELLKTISQYDLALFLLSDDEPFGYAPIEAMLKGVPVMITSKTGVSEILKDKYDAIFIKDRTDINELSEKIIFCSKSPDTLGDMKKNAVSTIKQRCDLDAVTIPALNALVEDLNADIGYSFDHVLAVCETLRYPFVELNNNINLKGARYTFIDTFVARLYNLPLAGGFLKTNIQKFVSNYRASR